MINRFDKPHRVLPTYDIKKGLELFSMVAKLDTHELLQHSLVNSIPLDVMNDMDENLIHEVVSIDPRKATDLNKLSVIKFLVTNGCNPDKPNKYNITPLHIACKQQLEEVVKYLLEIGCNPNYKDNMGLTPFHYLLTGNIKTIGNTNDVMDFNPPPKNVDVDKQAKLVEIKQVGRLKESRLPAPLLG
jgi:ankyrin repeat protein